MRGLYPRMTLSNRTALGVAGVPTLTPAGLGRGGIACSQINLHHCLAATVECGGRMGVTRKTTTSNGQRTMNLNNGQINNDLKQIILVQEPYWRDKKVKFFHDCNVYASSADENRACIITHKNITGTSV